MLDVLSRPLLLECSFEDSRGGPESETRRSSNKKGKNSLSGRSHFAEKNGARAELSARRNYGVIRFEEFMVRLN